MDPNEEENLRIVEEHRTTTGRNAKFTHKPGMKWVGTWRKIEMPGYPVAKNEFSNVRKEKKYFYEWTPVSGRDKAKGIERAKALRIEDDGFAWVHFHEWHEGKKVRDLSVARGRVVDHHFDEGTGYERLELSSIETVK